MRHAHAQADSLLDCYEDESSAGLTDERAESCEGGDMPDVLECSPVEGLSGHYDTDADDCDDYDEYDDDYLDDYEGDQIVYCDDDDFPEDEYDNEGDMPDESDAEALSYTYEELLDLHGSFIYRFKGTSMAPMLDDSEDLVVIERRPEGRLNLYDVVLFKRPAASKIEYVLHRIIQVCPDGYQCAGDNEYMLEFVPENQVIGVLTAFIHQNKRIPVTDPEYLEYVHQWCDHFDLRCKIFKARAKFRSIKHKLKI